MIAVLAELLELLQRVPEEEHVPGRVALTELGVVVQADVPRHVARAPARTPNVPERRRGQQQSRQPGNLEI